MTESLTLYRRDIVAVLSDAIADITELERIRFVMNDGKVVKNDFAAR